MGNLVLLKDHVVDAQAVEAVTDRQPRLAAADHDYAVVHSHRNFEVWICDFGEGGVVGGGWLLSLGLEVPDSKQKSSKED